MRDQGLIMGVILGAALLLPVPGFAQDLTMPPSMMQSPTMPMPDSSEPPASAAPANPQTQPPENKAQEKKSAKTAASKAKLRPTEAGAAETEAAPSAKSKGAAKSRMAKNGARGPRDIVATIYRVSAGADGSYDGPSAFDDARIRQLYFSKDLNVALAASEAKSSGEAVVNFDPITNSEGPDVQDLHIALESATPNRVSVAAKFTSTSDSSIVHYDFVKEGSAWKLDDIRGEIVGQDGQWSLREILKNSLQRS